MKVLSRTHFFNLLDGGQEEFRIETVTPGGKQRTISEDAPFDRDDPMSYVLVDIIFDRITVFAKGDFSAHDIAEAERTYGQDVRKALPTYEELVATVRTLQDAIGNSATASA